MAALHMHPSLHTGGLSVQQTLSRRCRSLRANAATPKGRVGSPLDSLSALLDSDAALDASKVWRGPPRQTSALRQHIMSPGMEGRFINEAVLRMDVRHGRPTPAASPLDVPMTQPGLVYLLLACQLLVYSFGTTLAVLKGAPAAEDLFMALAVDPSALVGPAASGEWWRLASATFLHAGMVHLTLNSWALGFAGAEAEAVLGHGVFLFAYLYSGAAGSVASLAVGGSQPTVAASAAMFGLLGAMMGTRLQNRRSLPARPSGQTWALLAIAAGNMAIAAAPAAVSNAEVVSNAGHLAGFAAGLAAGWYLGPRFQVVREVDIPEGSVVVPEDAREMAVVVDRRGAPARVATGAAMLGALALAAAAVAGSSHV